MRELDLLAMFNGTVVLAQLNTNEGGKPIVPEDGFNSGFVF